MQQNPRGERRSGHRGPPKEIARECHTALVNGRGCSFNSIFYIVQLMNVGFVYRIPTSRESSFLVRTTFFLDRGIKRMLGNTLSFQLDLRSM